MVCYTALVQLIQPLELNQNELNDGHNIKKVKCGDQRIDDTMLVLMNNSSNFSLKTI